MHTHEQPASSPKAFQPGSDTTPEPAVVSLSRVYRTHGRALEASELARRISLVLGELALVIRQGGGFIGHIKTFVTFDQGGALGMSVVRDRVDAKEFDYHPEAPVAEFKIAVTAIVYGYAKAELTRLVSLGLAVGLPDCAAVPAAAQKGSLVIPLALNPKPLRGEGPLRQAHG